MRIRSVVGVQRENVLTGRLNSHVLCYSVNFEYSIVTRFVVDDGLLCELHCVAHRVNVLYIGLVHQLRQVLHGLQ